jgi:hypothetical protein
MATGNQFVVAIDGITLSAQQRQRLNTAIQRAALAELATLGTRVPLGTHFPREWLGIWIGQIDRFNRRAVEALKVGRVR